MKSARTINEKSLYIQEGSLELKWLDALLSLDTAVADGTLQILKVVRSRAIDRKASDEHRPGADTVTENWKRLVLSAANPNDNIVFKLFHPRTVARRMYYRYVYSDPLARSYRRYKELENGPVRTVKSLSRGYVSRRGLFLYSFFAMESLRGVINIIDYLDRFLKRNNHSDRARELLTVYLASRLAKVHNSGFYHDDIKPDHLYVDDGPESIWLDPDETQDWVWIDLERVSLTDRIAPRQRLRNLFQFWRDFVRPLGEQAIHVFLRQYRSEVEEEIPSEDVLRRQIEKMASREPSLSGPTQPRFGYSRIDADRDDSDTGLS